MISLIVAYDLARNIGFQGDMPWGLDMKADLGRFKELTKGKVLVMGRKTFESLPTYPYGLPRRHNIILSRDPALANEVRGKKMLELDINYKNLMVLPSIEEFFQLAKLSEGKEFFVIGGASLYEQFMPYADRIYVTKIHELFEGDTKFPEITGDWDTVNGPILTVEGDKYPTEYITYTRRS